MIVRFSNCSKHALVILLEVWSECKSSAMGASAFTKNVSLWTVIIVMACTCLAISSAEIPRLGTSRAGGPSSPADWDRIRSAANEASSSPARYTQDDLKCLGDFVWYAFYLERLIQEVSDVEVVVTIGNNTVLNSTVEEILAQSAGAGDLAQSLTITISFQGEPLVEIPVQDIIAGTVDPGDLVPEGTITITGEEVLQIGKFVEKHDL